MPNASGESGSIYQNMTTKAYKAFVLATSCTSCSRLHSKQILPQISNTKPLLSLVEILDSNTPSQTNIINTAQDLTQVNMPHSCTAQKALSRGLRPNLQQKMTFGICSKKCIFCDIWRLATLLATHVSLSSRYSASPIYRSQRQDADFQRSEKRIQAQMQTQRVQLAGIMSMCTFEDAVNTPGFRKAFSKCYYAIQDLLCEEANLEDRLIRPSAASRRPSRDMGCGVDSGYSYERRSSRVGLV